MDNCGIRFSADLVATLTIGTSDNVPVVAQLIYALWDIFRQVLQQNLVGEGDIAV